MAQYLPISAARLEDVPTHTKNDPELQIIIIIIIIVIIIISSQWIITPSWCTARHYFAQRHKQA